MWIREIAKRGTLRAGVSVGFVGFSRRIGPASIDWEGFDVDCARAVAIAVFDDPGRIDFIPLRAADRFQALQAGMIDIGLFNASATLQREVGHGIAFAHPTLFDGERLMTRVHAPPAPRRGSRIAAIRGSTTRHNLLRYIDTNGLGCEVLEFDTPDEARDSYVVGQCDYYCLDRYLLYGERTLCPDPDQHVILDDAVSYEYMSPAVSTRDPSWHAAVACVARTLIAAEELGLHRATEWAAASRDRAVDAYIRATRLAAGPLGLQPDFALRIVSQLGDYGEIFARNLGERSALRAPRCENVPRSRGGLLFSPAFL
ncbi:transporter substrate-binding domain-containing protein [Methylobacterium sp. JK268]